MSCLQRLAVTASRSLFLRQITSFGPETSTRGIAALSSVSGTKTLHPSLNSPSAHLLQWHTTSPIQIQQVRHYKARDVLTKRCKGCYFERRDGRWYVECTLKPRHKQMQRKNKHNLYKDDYSKGNVHVAYHWGHQTQRFYRQGDNKYSRYNWLEGRLGTEV